jgi:hypothetical protein
MESSRRWMPGRICCRVGRRRARGPAFAARQVEEVGAFGFVQPEGAGEGFQDTFGDAAELSPLQTGVVLGADAGEHGDLFAAQPGDAPVAAPGRESGLLRGDLGSPRDQKLADLAAVVHVFRG